MQGGPDPEAIFAAHPVAAGADPLAVTTALAAFAGFLLGGARLPDPPGLPTLRAFQLGRAWSPSTGCAGGPAGPDRPGETPGLDEGPAQLLQPGCRPLSALAQAR